LPGPGEEFRFLRFEVVPSPVVLRRTGPLPGESVERVVLRSSLEDTAEAFAAANPRFATAGERHIAPPKTSQLLAEMFGLFDPSIGTGADLDDVPRDVPNG
jgi:hypothetical protein